MIERSESEMQMINKINEKLSKVFGHDCFIFNTETKFEPRKTMSRMGVKLMLTEEQQEDLVRFFATNVRSVESVHCDMIIEIKYTVNQ